MSVIRQFTTALLLNILIFVTTVNCAFKNITTQSFTIPYSDNGGSTTLLSKLTTANGVNGPYSYAVLLIHGADGDMDSYNVQPLAEHLTAQHGVPVLRFDMLLRGDIPSRAQQAFAALEFLKTKVSATTYIPVGRSLGSRVVAQMMASGGIGGCLAYPMIGNDATDETGIADRRQLVLSIKPDAKVLFVIGSEDTLTSVTDLDQARRDGKAKTWRATITGANHVLNLPPQSFSGSPEGVDLWATIVIGTVVGWIKDIAGLSPPVANWEVNGWAQGGDAVITVKKGVESTQWAGSTASSGSALSIKMLSPWAHVFGVSFLLQFMISHIF
ncbi:hypothetical protein BJ742DRAFT_345857 [Cladochytrium replicatum]|nr:hypothetical protein BJ742DRAFT_345857 [Cladochytrium replicatum]